MANNKSRIDVHHHVVPPFFRDALEKNGGDPSGWHIPAWDVKSDQDFSAAHGIGTCIFSLTAPGPDVVEGEAAVRLARQTNEYLASLRDQDPARYGFFAAVPSLTTNITAALAEITYALDELKADGVTLMTRYGEGNQYLGDASFVPVWDLLDAKGAVVFVHPTHSAGGGTINPHLPQPIVDYPHETTRAAMDMIMSDTLRAHPRCRVILSHAGGTLPWLAKRAAYGLDHTKLIPKSTTDFLADVRSFYYDLALSSTAEVITLLRQFTDPDHILYGSDYPYAPTGMISAFVADLDKAPLDPDTEHAIDRGNALKLFPRFGA
ncbi:hypothetical protein SLS62_010683 [Diatrype stigma]|uniref:6-methylsalicylate decarboxylase n=1 Tax=Diatrype stigma TaxID=117547 RepID=A0AAN9UAP8_9PEZI